MNLPDGLRSAIEQRAEGVPQSRLRAAAQGLSLRYRSEPGGGKRLASTELDTLAYAAVRMPATYGAVCSALNYALERGDPGIRTVLDVGAGVGTAAWAVGSAVKSAERIVCLEREPAMIELGKALMGADPSLLAKTEWVNGDMREMDLSATYDLVVASYALGELRDPDRERAVLSLWGAAKKLLLIVEPGTPLASSHLRAARARLIGEGAAITAPCPHSDACPLPDGDWCHFTCRVGRSRLHKQLKGGDAPYEDEKFSYLAVSRGPARAGGGRVLRHPLVEKGRITLKLCTGDGLETRTVTREQREDFKAARKAKCGDAFS